MFDGQPVHIVMTEWSQLVEVATTFEIWQNIVKHMFEDGEVNQGRLMILHLYTQDVIDHLRSKEEGSSSSTETESEKIGNFYTRSILNIGYDGSSG